jgi:4-hydroxythreonine-4-phosphate dehydrogenase
MQAMANDKHGGSRPLLALALGDPCGISPELTARLAGDTQVADACRLIVIGDRRVFAAGCRDARLPAAELPAWHPSAAAPAGHAFYDLAHLDPAAVTRGEASAAGGAFALANFTTALALAREGALEAVSFTPFNKHAMRLARPDYDDEIAVITETLRAPRHGREFNILGRLWNARVTSHIPLKEVSAHLTVESIAAAGLLAARCLREAGFDKPRLAVAGLNPHAGDGGSFGREEIDVIAPAVARLRAEGVTATGPLPADTVFVRARKGEFDAVLTMYHDQGQIAMKLMGFEAGVTFIGGYDVPVCTPAHGTAYDIAGQGRADLGAARNAVLLAAAMAARRRVARAA